MISVAVIWFASDHAAAASQVMSSDRGVSRSPIFSATKQILEIVHLSTITEFIQQHSKPPPAPALTYGDLQAEPTLGPMLKTSFAIVAETATIADARRALNATANCEDVFVTKTGQATEAVLGWITDNVILEVEK